MFSHDLIVVMHHWLKIYIYAPRKQCVLLSVGQVLRDVDISTYF